ncbi:MAG: aconitate hydratase AcnA [Acidimicrobiia bacterium]|nr:aconitate hydratase AcnA [Acidimicrobiia bacterium]MDH3396525.1 aconitate hydratase AcnA [Acidimicrobiia bacterium]
MSNAALDPFQARTSISTPLGERTIYRLDALRDIGDINTIPYSIKVLTEAVLRNYDGVVVRDDDVRALASYDARKVAETEIPFKPGRVVLQDFTGVPAIVDLAAMRAAVVRMTGDPDSAQKVNPLVQCDLVIDHSVQVDAFNSGMALQINSEHEFERNRERYEFLKWGQSAFTNFRVVPPATGIVHQVNLEYLAQVVWDNGRELYPDSLVGTDSHTTMINGIGVVGWGAGGIEVEAVMVGQPIYMLIPEVVGFKLTGRLVEGTTATDLVLRVTQMLREHGVVEKFVEFHGSGLADMPLANRATIANMAPEYGATMGFFPVDDQTLKYMRLTGRDEALLETVEQYYRAQGLWRDESHDIVYSSTLELDMSTVEPALAGPKRPQDRIDLSGMKAQWRQDLVNTFGKPSPAAAGTVTEWEDEGGPIAEESQEDDQVLVDYDGQRFSLNNGDVVIAAITSCTNTSNPSVMVGAGLVARKARRRGLTRKPWVKTSLAPGSKVVTDYLDRAGLTEDLEAAGFYLVGYGCTTCIGNSGPLPDPIREAIHDHDLVATSVLSGNRNFEGRISPDAKANYLASPPLVVAYALAGTVDIDLTTEPIGKDPNGSDVYLRDLWPTQSEIDDIVASSVTRQQFVTQYADVFEGSAEWKAIETTGDALYAWNVNSTYVQEPPFFQGLTPDPSPIGPIHGARVLAKLGDSVTTDHISPAGSIAEHSPAGQYLIDHGVEQRLFNSYGSRRGNDQVMTRGTFANIRVRNQLAPEKEGGFTTDFTDDTVKTIYEASLNYKSAGIPLVILAGKDYGMGSSRDWAAKGTYELGARAVIATSFERIHRSNLVGMGVLPLTFMAGQDADSLGLDGSEIFSIDIDDDLRPRQEVIVTAEHPNGSTVDFTTICRADTPVEVEYYRNGGILHTVLRKMAKS